MSQDHPGAASPAGPQTLSLPQGWDFGRDLAVLLGGGLEEALLALLQAGQERLFLVPGPAGAGVSDERVVLTRTLSELIQACLELAGESPRQAIVHLSRDDPWASTERHREVAQTLERALGSRRMQLETLSRHGPTWLLQGLGNVRPLADQPSVDALRGAFAGWPCVIASPGPSLVRNVDQLAALRGRALLMAGTHSLAPLERAGAPPQLCVLADPGDLARHVAGVDLEPIESFVVGATCRRENFAFPVRRTFSFACNGHIDDWLFELLGEEAALSSGGSVACSQLSLALLLGCDPIVFVGQDLSFPDGNYYAPGGADGEARVELGRDGTFFLRKPAGSEGPGPELADGSVRFTIDREVVEVPGYHGGTVPSSKAFAAFLTWFEGVAGSQEGRVRLLNCTEGGAFIRGMEHVPLASVTSDWRPREASVGEVLDAAVRDHDAERRRDELARGLRGLRDALKPVAKAARRCRSLVDRARRDPGVLKELGSAEGELSRRLKPLTLFALVAQEEVRKAQEAAREARTLPENLAAARRLYDVVLEAVRFLDAPLQRAVEELV